MKSSITVKKLVPLICSTFLFACGNSNNDLSNADKAKIEIERPDTQEELYLAYKEYVDTKDHELKAQYNQLVDLTFEEQNIPQDNKRDNILILDYGMVYDSIYAYQHRIAKIYELNRSNASITPIQPTITIPYWQAQTFKNLDSKGWPLFSESMSKINSITRSNRDLFQTAPKSNNKYIGHGDEILSTIIHTTKESKIILISDIASGGNGRENFMRNISCSKGENYVKESISNYFNKLSNQVLDIAQKNNVGIMNFSGGIDAYSVIESFNDDCYSMPYFEDLIAFYQIEFNSIFKKLGEENIISVQAMSINDGRNNDPNANHSRDVNTVNQMSFETIFASDIESIPFRIRTGNIRGYSNQQIESITNSGIDFNEAVNSFNFTKDRLRLLEEGSDILIARHKDQLTDFKVNKMFNIHVSSHGIFLERTGSRASSYNAPYITSFLQNVRNEHRLTNSEIIDAMNTKLKKINSIKSLSTYLKGTWPFTFNDYMENRLEKTSSHYLFL